MAERKQFPEKTALALSGGGFRATLFHLGTLIRLNEIGLLPKLKTVSSISGGSITGAYLGLKWRNLKFDQNGVASNLDSEIIQPLRKLCSKDIDSVPTIRNMFLMLIGQVSTALAANYEKHLFGQATLDDLPAENNGPDFIFLASNIQTNSRVWISRDRLWDERLGVFKSPELNISTVVSASSGLPPFLSPVIVHSDPAKWQSHESSDLFDEEKLRKKMILADGGIHDPSGVEPVFENHDTILVSDANVSKEIWRKPSSFWIRQTGRSTILQTIANREVRRRLLERCACLMEDNKIIWWALTDEIEKIGAENIFTHDSDSTKALGILRTRLGPFTPSEQGGLINWAYALCDASLKKTGHIDPAESPEPTWPVEEFPL